MQVMIGGLWASESERGRDPFSAEREFRKISVSQTQF